SCRNVRRVPRNHRFLGRKKGRKRSEATERLRIVGRGGESVSKEILPPAQHAGGLLDTLRPVRSPRAGQNKIPDGGAAKITPPRPGSARPPRPAAPPSPSSAPRRACCAIVGRESASSTSRTAAPIACAHSPNPTPSTAGTHRVV